MWSGASVGRRTFLTGALATGAAVLTTGAAGNGGVPTTLRRNILDATVQDIDLGGPVVRTWAYGDRLPGKELRARKDTAIVPARRSMDAYFVADNPGDWVTHCYNEYHMAAGMMTTVVYG